jgi:hypothetical protein
MLVIAGSFSKKPVFFSTGPWIAHEAPSARNVYSPAVTINLSRSTNKISLGYKHFAATRLLAVAYIQ